MQYEIYCSYFVQKVEGVENKTVPYPKMGTCPWDLRPCEFGVLFLPCVTAAGNAFGPVCLSVLFVLSFVTALTYKLYFWYAGYLQLFGSSSYIKAIGSFLSCILLTLM